MNALELRGLTKHYKDFTLGPLDLTLPGGTICGLMADLGLLGDLPQSNQLSLFDLVG